MRNSVRGAVLVLCTAVLAFSAVPVPGQPPGGPSMPRLFGDFAPETGSWAEYAVTDSAAGTEMKMRMAIVGKEDDAFWYEVENDAAGGRNIIKMLVTGDPNKSTENIRRMIIKSGDAAAMEMPRDFLVMGRQMAGSMFEKRSGVRPSPEPEGSIEEIGTREVTVPAGTFSTKQYRIRDAQGTEVGTYDISDKVPPFGIVLSETRNGTLKLLGHGDDAVSAITEEPTPMPVPPGMPGLPGGMPPGMGPGR